MQIKRLTSICIILFFLLSSSILTITTNPKSDSIPTWDESWSHYQEIILPISTVSSYAKFQPIDIKMIFDDLCWANNEKEHSIRVVCWDGQKWHELESQIYDLEFIDTRYISSCNLIFLIPSYSNGKERYFVYYDDNNKPAPDYIDHVEIEDKYYYYEPISGILAEGDYFKITEDGYCVYGVGQKGSVVDRKLSQCIISQKPEIRDFDVLNSYHVASFCFSYNHGSDDKDEISSDQILISKEIVTDGNLMVEFGIVSESNNGEIRSTNLYKYYYCPKNKRICINVKHEVLKDAIVSGMKNIDGRYGTLFSFKSRSERLHEMRFGDILPYLHVYNKNNDISEYQLNLNPENYEREWIIPYQDDCDIGKDAWFSYDEGEHGISHAIIFSSNENIVKSGTNERDGIQIKLAEREYLDVIGTEIDYVAINFGRNSYEKNSYHDLKIPDDLVVEYDAEVFTSLNGGYKDIPKEAEIYRTLVKYRQNGRNESLGTDKKIHTLTVIPRFTGRLFSNPFFRDFAGLSITEIRAELYQDNELISVDYTTKPFLSPPKIKFPKLSSGEYIVKIYRRNFKSEDNYIGIEKVKVEKDTDINIYCTWQKNIEIKCRDQYEKGINDIEFILIKNDTIVDSNITNAEGMLKISAPFNLFNDYVLQGFYKGFMVYNKKNPMREKNLDINLNLYDLTVILKDKLGLEPGVDVRPFLTSSNMDNNIKINPESLGSGRYIFKNLPEEIYTFQVSYGAYKDVKDIKIPEIGDSLNVQFSALFDLSLKLFDSSGNTIEGNDKEIKISRGNHIVYNNIKSHKPISLPPGKYTIDVYFEGRHISTKNIELINNKKVNIVTTIKSIISLLITGIVLVFIAEIIVLLFFKRISVNTFLKLISMSLILISLFQPWWVLYASSENPVAEKSNEMFILPQNMIEKIDYEGVTYLDFAVIPEIFTDLLGILLLIVISGFILLGISFIPNIILKRRFYKILIFTSVLFLILVALVFSLGMSRITDISVGSLRGHGNLDVILPDGTSSIMYANWTMGLGFYLCIMAALIALFAGVLGSVKKRKWPITLSKKILKF